MNPWKDSVMKAKKQFWGWWKWNPPTLRWSSSGNFLLNLIIIIIKVKIMLHQQRTDTVITTSEGLVSTVLSILVSCIVHFLLEVWYRKWTDKKLFLFFRHMYFVVIIAVVVFDAIVFIVRVGQCRKSCVIKWKEILTNCSFCFFFAFMMIDETKHAITLTCTIPSSWWHGSDYLHGILLMFSGSNVTAYVGMVCDTLRNSIPKAIVHCQVREAKRSLLNFFYAQVGAREVHSFPIQSLNANNFWG